jgi:MFS family permease
MIGGRIADKRARKATMLTFQSLAAATLIPCGFLGTSIAVPWLLILSSFFQGIAEPVNDAMITDMTVADQRTSPFSLLYLGHNMGFARGPVIAGFLFNRYMQWIFFGDAATTTIALVVVAIFTRESKPTEAEIEESFAHDETPEKAEHGGILRVLLRRPFLLAFMFVHVLYSLVYSQVGFGLPLQLSATFGDAGPRLFGVIMTVNAAAVILLTTFVLNTTRKIPPVLTVSISGLFFAAGFGFLHLFDSLAILIAFTLLWTIGEILGATNASAYVANHAPITHRARVNAIAPIIMYSGQAIGPPLAGLLIDRYSVADIWPLTLLLSLAGSGMLMLLFLFERRKTSGRAER